MDKDVELEQGLRYVYYSPKTGYQSAERLYQEALEPGQRRRGGAGGL